MRLIDADEFISSLHMELPTDTIDACELRIKLIQAPTVDPCKECRNNKQQIINIGHVGVFEAGSHVRQIPTLTAKKQIK